MFGRRIDALEECCKEYRIRFEQMTQVDSELISELKLMRARLEEHKLTFENHDRKEMEKYDDIRRKISKMGDDIMKFNKIMWLVIGAAAILNFVGVGEAVKKAMASAIYQPYKHADHFRYRGEK